MNHKKNGRERWLALLAGLVFVFGMGVVIGHTGFRVDAGALGNVFGLTPHQWGVLLSGLFGSIAGGAVAIWVLKRTLEHQEALHSGQLLAQNAEATRQRSTAAAASILSGLWLVNRASKKTADEMEQQIDAVILGIHSLRLESEHESLAGALVQMVGELESTPEIVIGNEEARQKLLKITGAISGAIVVWFQSSDCLEKTYALNSIRNAEKAAADLVAFYAP